MEPDVALPQGWQLTHRPETGSTNADALSAARQGSPGCHWFTADRQISGKGRQGRVWVSDPGNLYASALLVDPAAPPDLATLPFAAALALHAAISGLPGMQYQSLKLKWPNDLLAGGAKISGILIEIDHLPNGKLAVACGFGVNLAHHPDPALYAATDLKALGFQVTPQFMLTRLSIEFEAVLTAWDRGRNFAAIRAEWLRHARGIGAPVVVNLPGRQVEGTFKDIDMDGCLLLVHKDGTNERISAGDVFFPHISGD